MGVVGVGCVFGVGVMSGAATGAATGAASVSVVAVVYGVIACVWWLHWTQAQQDL